MGDDLLVAVDGGNSKTDLALFDQTGRVLALVRGKWSSPHQLGLAGSLYVVEGLLADARLEAGIADRPVALANLCLAGLDFPQEETAYAAEAERRAIAQRILVGNDTFAVLRAGTDRPWGVAVVCGAGINCVGVGPDGRTVRFQSLGPISGDWGGGQDIGMAAISAAARSEDGRGDKTSLHGRVPKYFGLETPHQVAESIHFGQIGWERVHEVAHLVFEEAPADPVSESIVERVADEVATMARVACERLGLGGVDAEIVLGGGIIRLGGESLVDRVRRRLLDARIELPVTGTEEAPVVGSALAALDAVSANSDAHSRLRRALSERARQLG